MENSGSVTGVARHKAMVFLAVVRHLATCDNCQLSTTHFRLDRACEVGVVLRDEYLLARTYARAAL